MDFDWVCHGHEKEVEYSHVVDGDALVCGIEIDNWEKPSKDLNINKDVLSLRTPSVCCLPSGYSNSLKFFSPNKKVIGFSVATFQESLGNSIGFDERY